MTDNLVKRLRETQTLYEQAGVDGSEGALQAGQAADRIEELEAKLAKAVEALHRISLGSQNSGTTKENLGREARATIAEIKGEQKCT